MLKARPSASSVSAVSTMATPTRASRALRFMRHCRRPQPVRQSSNAASSPYAPSNFTGPAPSPSRSPTSSTADADNSSPFLDTASTLSRLPSYAHPKSRPPPPVEIPGTRLTAYTWLLSLLGFPPKPTSSYKPAPFHIQNNPYRARKKWPPDFRNLDAKQQFHFEKTYRRRAALKWARPRWNKAVKILQHTLITSTIIYFVFICDPSHGMGTPFDGVRDSRSILLGIEC